MVLLAHPEQDVDEYCVCCVVVLDVSGELRIKVNSHSVEEEVVRGWVCKRRRGGMDQTGLI